MTNPAEEQRKQLEKAALEISRRYREAGERMPELIGRDGERFAAGYLEGIGQAADLLRPFIDWRAS